MPALGALELETPEAKELISNMAREFDRIWAAAESGGTDAVLIATFPYGA